MKIPTTDACMELLKKNCVPENIIKHSIVVNEISMLIGKKLIEHGEKINLPLLNAGSLLHDLDKWETINEGHNHAKIAHKKLHDMGCPEVAQIILKHVINLSPGEKDPFSNWEERIVYYSDKLVNNYTIVSIDERYDYLIRKYGNNEPERCRSILCTKEAVLELEKDILSKAGLKSGDIRNLIRSEKSAPIYK